MNLAAAVQQAHTRLRPWVTRTPVVAATVDRASQGTLHYKCENLQRTGSFKFRGALNKVLLLNAAERNAIVTASTGNHALAIAAALEIAGGKATAVVPATAAAKKIDRLIEHGLRLMRTEGDPLNAEVTAREIAARDGGVYISPYNDLDVIAGQGTIGLEVLEQLPEVDAVYVSVGGGGLISGIAAAVKAVRPTTKVIGCFPQNATAMFASMRRGDSVLVPERPTLSDATAGNLEPGAITIALCRELVDDCVIVPEEEIALAVHDVAVHDHLVVEGAAGVAVAGFRHHVVLHPEYANAVSLIVLCGGHIDPVILASILNGRFNPFPALA